MLDVGTVAPAFTAQDEHGRPVSLDDYEGRWVLLWWYPKALTPGCTSCGQGLQQRIREFTGSDCEIVGLSFDPPERNLAFVQRYGFGYPLLSASYDLGRTYGTKRDDQEDWADVPRRISYLIDPVGCVAKAYRVLDPTQHPEQVLRDLQELRARSRFRPFARRSR